MNQSQVKYARERLTAMRHEHQTALQKKHTQQEVKISLEEKLKAIKHGRYTLKDPSRHSSYYWADRIDFNEERPHTVDTISLNADKAKLDAEFTRLMDQLVLGDAEGALQALEAFAAWQA